MTAPTSACEPPPANSRSTAGRELLIAWVHLAVLWAFAIGRPLFQVLQDSPEFFVARGNTSADIVLFAIALTLLPPTLLLICEAVLVPLGRARRLLHLAFVGLLVAAIAVQTINGIDTSGKLLVLVALACGLAGAVAYARTRVAPAMLSVLGPAPVVFLALFLLVSPVSDLVRPQNEVSAMPTGISGSTPVVVVVFDEFAGSTLLDEGRKIDATRFPNLAAFAGHATWYRNATTVADQTVRAVPAILTGSRSSRDRLPTASAYPQNLFTALGERYSFDVDEPITDLCPDQLCHDSVSGSASSRLRSLFDDLSVVSAHLLAPPDLEHRLPAVDRTFAGFRNAGRDTDEGSDFGAGDLPSAAFENRVARFERFADALDGGGSRPQLGFLHIALPHVPWQYLPSGQSYPVSGPDTPGLQDEHWGKDPWLAAQAEQRYLLQLGFADRLVGRLMSRLREAGLYDGALIVLTADHGVSFRADENRRAVSAGNIVDIAGVPLLIKTPGQRQGEIDDGFARTVDILATIAKTLGGRLPTPIDGRPLPHPVAGGEVVTVDRYGGGRVRIPFDTYVQQRDAAVRRRIDVFGSGDGFARLFAAGPDPDLVGRSVGSVPAAPESGVHAELDFRREYSAFEPDAPEVPAFVTAQLSGSAAGGETIAIAVNRRIVAVTHSYLDGSDVRVGAIVPPTAFTRGENRVEALAVTGEGESARVAPIGQLQTEQATLVRRGGELVVVPSKGPEIRVVPGVADGFIDTLSEDDDGIDVSGWASDASHTKAADRVMLFAGDRLLQATRPSIVRTDLAKSFGIGLAKAGFAFTDSAVEGADEEELRVIAVVGGRASELRR